MDSFAYRGVRQYTLKDGLAGMRVEDLCQDRRGLLWIATADGGVSRFDGEVFENFGLSDGLPHLTVMSIVEDAVGRMWFGTLGGGLAAFDGRGFQVYTTEHGLPSNEIIGLQPQPDDSVHVLTGEGIGRFAGGRCVECTTEIGGQPIGRVHDMVTDSEGTTWLATRTRGIISLEGHSMSPLFQRGAHKWAWKLAQDASGHLWIASHRRNREAVVGRYDPRSRHLDLIDVEAPSEVAQIVTPGIRHVRVDRRGWLWMAQRGVLVYDGRGWHPFSAGLSGTILRNTRLTYEDGEENIWVGSWGSGLVFCSRSGVKRYTGADGLPDPCVRCLAEDRRGRIWIGTARGGACLKDDTIHPMKAGPAVVAMEVDRRGTLWIGDADGRVSKGTSAEPRVVADLAAAGHGRVTGLCGDRDGRLWVGTFDGLLGHIKDDQFVALEERLSRRCTTILQDSGALWIGSAHGSPALHCRDSTHRLHASDFVGLEAVYEVNALCKYAGMLWLGTGCGLFSLDLRSRQVRRFTMDQGLSANHILSLGTDRQGRLWIGTDGGGALVYDGQAFHRLPNLGECPQEDTVHTILCDRLGTLWFGTEAGLICYRPYHASPGIVIRHAVEGRLLEAPDSVSFLQGTTEVTIHFQGIRFRIDGDPLLYSHRLVASEAEGEWSEFTKANRVSYQDLPAGEYRFEVRVRDPEGNVSEAAHLQVRVLPDANDQGSPQLEHQRQGPVDSAPGHGATMTRLLSHLRRVAATDMTVLLRGETGTGKSLLARGIHDLSPRRRHAFVHVNCRALTSALVEIQLCGHDQVLSGEERREIGLMEQAHEGTLFFDEVADLPPEGQQALVHMLEDGLLRRVGGVTSVPVDVRVIAATNRDLGTMVREEAFRAELYYRLKAFPVILPPLRARREEIPGLAAHFAAEWARQLNCSVPTLTEETTEYLQKHSWPGNIDELAALMRRGVILCEGAVMEVSHVSLPAEPEGLGSSPPHRTEKQQIMDALQATKGRIYGEYGAAKLLGMNPERLRSRMRVHGLQRPKVPRKSPSEGQL